MQQPSELSQEREEPSDGAVVAQEETSKPSLTPTAPATLRGRVSSFNGHKLHSQEWRPEGEIRGLMCICHGLSEHQGRYQKLGQAMAESGILTFGLDLVGHGRSEGDRSHIDDFDHYIRDVVSYVQDVKQEYPSLPLFLFGHSMGGLISSATVIRHPSLFNGLVLSSPALQDDSGIFLKLGARLIALFAPQAIVKRIDPTTISSVVEEAEEYRNDPLIFHGGIKAKLGVALINCMAWVQAHIGEITIPVFALQGEMDTLVLNTSARFAYDSVSSEDKQLEMFPSSRHEVFHDVDQERARKLVRDWIVARAIAPVVEPGGLQGTT